jgi:hypothetical protein
MNMMKRILTLAAAAVLAGPSVLAAITVLPLSEEEITKRAMLIVMGEVRSVESRFDEKHQTIYTYVTLEATRVLKGQLAGSEVVVRQMGGEAGGETVAVPGSPEYTPGDEVLLFTGPLGDTGYWGVLGIFYGKYDILRDPATGARYVEGPSFRTVHTDPVTFEALPQRQRPARVMLDEFLAEIERYIAND